MISGLTSGEDQTVVSNHVKLVNPVYVEKELAGSLF